MRLLITKVYHDYSIKSQLGGTMEEKINEVIELLIEKAKRELQEQALVDDKSNDTVLALAA